MSNLVKMAESSPNGMKTLWEKEKLLVTSNFSLSNSVSKGLDCRHVKKGLVLEKVKMMRSFSNAFEESVYKGQTAKSLLSDPEG